MRGLAAVAVVATFVTACSTALESSTTGDEQSTSSTGVTIPDDTQHGIVSGVVDGDTVQMTINEESMDVALAGVRAPQGEECYAEAARLALAQLTAGRSVAVWGTGTDEDGIPLRYLMIDDDDRIFVNLELVDLGAAAALHGHEFAGDFLRVNAGAYASGRGMWGTFACGHPEGGITPDRPALRIDTVNIPDPATTERASVEIVNASYTEIAIGGWTMRDAGSPPGFTFPPRVVLTPGDVASVALDCAGDDDSGLAWCVDTDSWVANGTTIIVQDQQGNVIERHVYEVSATP
ncbi:MAG: lamin tail domain-containing protein [Acidimicrobiia bacterium]